jgi:Big-like domain-containing protein
MDWAMRRLALGCTIIALATAACSGAPDQATAPAATKAAGPLSSLNCTADPASITALSIALFPGGNQNAVLTRWLQIADLLSPPSPYDPATANTNTYNLVDYILTKYSSGQTIGGQSAANAALVTSLVNQIFCYSGIDASLPGLGPDEGAGLYGPNSPATLITTGNKQGGVSLPPGNGNVSQQTLITIQRVPDSPGPLLTPLDQYPLFYEFNSSSGEEFTLDAVVGVCTIATDFSRLRVAHNVPEPVPTTIEILPIVPAPFLDCSNASLSLGPNPTLRQFANWGLGQVGRALQSVLMPAQLSAASVLGTGGLAGTTKKFSPFGSVDTLGFETGAAPTSGQSAPEGGTVTTPPAVQVKSPNGVGMKGITVTFSVTGGGGTLTPAGGGSASSSIVGTTDDTGYVTTGSWTLGTGAQTVTAVATPPHPGSGIDPLTGIGFSATANPPTKLAYSVAPTDQTAGTAFGVTVLVQDVNGATVPASSASVSLTLNGGPAGTLQGTTTANASQGVATFSNLVITRAGTYTLTASSASLTSATSANFTISAAAAQTIAINAGNNQTAPENTVLGVAAGTTAPSVIVKDAYLNPVPGVGVEFAIASGGGSVSGASQTTNASGIATVGSWTIVAGTNTLTASAPSIGALAFVQFTATGTSPSTVLVNCSPANGNGDDLTHAFYVNKLGKTIKEVTLYMAVSGTASAPTPYTIKLLASADSYGATPFASSTQTVFLRGNASQNLATNFIFPNSAIPSGTKNVAFQFQVLSNTGGRKLSFALTSGSCASVTETVGVLPLPLSTALRKGVGVRILGN